MKEWLLSYLTFSKKERTGIIVLTTLILSIWLLPEFFGRPQKISNEIKARADSFVAGKHTGPVIESAKTFHLFSFDPNTIPDGDWEKLGLSQKTISTIRNYLSKGGRFREPDDIKKIYGLKQEDAERLMPYVRIAGGVKKIQPYYPRPTRKDETVYSRAYTAPSYPRRLYQKPKLFIDINKADSMEWESLPGIGVKLASRIVKFRESLGGFHRVDQVSEVYGIDDTLFNLIRPALHFNSGIYRKIRINEWDADSIDIHPYIQKHQANAIVKYRTQHGRFNDTYELVNINILTNEWIERIKPYIILE